MSLSLPLIFNLGPTELIIILVIVLLLFGGSRLAGLGKSSGRALKEFKEETKGLRDSDKPNDGTTGTAGTAAPYTPTQQVNGSTGPTTPYPPVPPTNLADPSATEVRKEA
jgi:sec-independent protein translocase protein TatA